MKLFTAPEQVPFDFDLWPTVFLAGSIEQGKAVDWQQDVIGRLHGGQVTILNPRRTAWDSTWSQTLDNPDFVEQVNWELDAIEQRAEIVFFYFQAGTMSPITLMELGIVSKLVSVDMNAVVVCEPGFWRKGNVDVLCRREGIPVFDNLGDGFGALKKLIEQG